MKLMTLNIWGGRLRDPLLEFISEYRDTEFFCFQEVYHNALQGISEENRRCKVSLKIFSELQAALPEHKAFFRPTVKGIYGIGMFVKNNVEILREGDVCIHHNPEYCGEGPTHSRNMQWAECSLENKTYAILNVHGLWNGKGKTDTKERINQSKSISDFMSSLHMPIILCGDFNLRPDTESVKIISRNMTNLVDQYGITGTRTRFYSKEEKFADYIFASPNIAVNAFEVLREEVSDHSPLLLDFEPMPSGIL